MTVLRFVLIALVLVLTSACGHSPIDPTVVGPLSPQVQVPPGAIPLNPIPLPESDNRTLIVWIEKLNPIDGSELATGQRASITWTCASEISGYSGFFSTAFLMEGQPEPDYTRLAGGSMAIKGKCDGIATHSLDVKENTPNVVGVRFYVWLVRGLEISGFPSRERPPDVVQDARFNWRHSIH